MAQVQAMQDKWAEAESMRSHLQNEANTLRKTCEVCASMSMLQQPALQGHMCEPLVTQPAVVRLSNTDTLAAGVQGPTETSL